MNEPQGDSPTQTSRHTIVRQEIHIFSKLLNAIRDDLTKNENTQHVRHGLKNILAWFIIDYFSHKINLKTRKNFRPQNTDDETVLAEQSGYVWDPEWSHESFINIPTDITSQAISTISINKDYVRPYPLTVDATPLNNNSFFTDPSETCPFRPIDCTSVPASAVSAISSLPGFLLVGITVSEFFMAIGFSPLSRS